jgi:hypothetical protein
MKIVIFGLYDYEIVHIQVSSSLNAFLVLFVEKEKNKSSNTGLVIDEVAKSV